VRVQFGAKKHGRALPVAEHADDARAADARRDFVSELAQLVRHARGGALLLQRQLGILVQIDVKRIELRINLIEAVRAARRRRARRGGSACAATYFPCGIDTTDPTKPKQSAC